MEITLDGFGHTITIYNPYDESTISLPALEDYSIGVNKKINENSVDNTETDDLSFEKMIELEFEPVEDNPYIWDVEISQKDQVFVIIHCTDPRKASNIIKEITLLLSEAKKLEFARDIELKQASSKPKFIVSEDDDLEDYESF